MINFFRNIRQKMINKNKITSYLLYAIGEIILVVIGILIALQINNWNEQNKKKQLKNEYVSSLTNDLSKDTLQLNNRIKANKERLIYLSSVTDSIRKGFYTKLDDYVQLRLRVFAPINVINTYNTNSFNLLISSGNIDLFNENLRTELMELNRLQQKEQVTQYSNKDVYIELFLNLRKKYPLFGDPYNSNISNQLLWKDVNVNEIPRDMLALITQETFNIITYIKLSETVFVQTKQVLKLLKDD